jgi:endonuclease/exonuclease/phosphatase family metal-dependent hydrolase
MGRDDGKEAGEFSAIFYNAKRYTRVADSTFWLSPTPDRPSKGWDAALNRIVTWVHLEDRGAGTLYVFNTHFDHMGQTARLESARLLMKQIFRIANSYPAVVTGDFNSSDTEPPYAVLTAKDPQANLHLFDTQLLSPFHNGPIKTYSGFDVHKGIIGERIDFIFVCEGLKVLQHATLTDFRSNEHFPSDHLPVIADIASVTRH